LIILMSKANLKKTKERGQPLLCARKIDFKGIPATFKNDYSNSRIVSCKTQYKAVLARMSTILTMARGKCIGGNMQKKPPPTPNQRNRRKIVGWTKYITLKNGKVIYAEDYGYKAFPIYG